MINETIVDIANIVNITTVGSPQEAIDDQIYQTVIDSNVPMPYDLYEMDWACIADYLDRTHIPPLFCLCSSSHASIWSFGSKSKGIPWVTLIHSGDIELQMMIIELIQHGTYVDRMICLFRAHISIPIKCYDWYRTMVLVDS